MTTELSNPPEHQARTGLSVWSFLGLVLTPFVLAAAIIVIVSVVDDGGGAPAASGQTYSFEIPAGTAERMARGEPVADVFPERMAARVGDTFVVVNLDDVTHQLGPVIVRGGETARITFYESGIYQGACTVGGHESVTITVS